MDVGVGLGHYGDKSNLATSVGTVTETGTETAFFGKTEPKRNRGFRRPNGRFGFGGLAYMVLVTVRVFVTGL